MKITIYELLGMIKDGNTPKTIRWYDEFYKDFDEISNKYTDFIYTKLKNGDWDLYTEVEIIEEPFTEEIEELVIDYAPDIEEKIFYDKKDKPNHCIVGDAGTELLINKINEIIRKLNEVQNENN